MRKLELELHNKAMEELISRRLINIVEDKTDPQYKAYVEVSNTNVSIETYLFLPSKDLSPEDACRIIMSLAVAYYLGMDVGKVREDLIKETKEPDQGDSKEEAKVESKPKRKARKKAAPKKSNEKSEDKEEEVEAKPEPKRQAKPKTIAYDRNQAEHKKELAKVLNENFPEWHKDKELTAKAKEASEQLVGVALFDAKGEVLGTFAQNVLELMSDANVDL